MLKRILSVIMVSMLLITLNVNAYVTYNNISDENTAHYKLFEKLGIVDRDDFAGYDTQITKGLFIKWAVKMTGVQSDMITTKNEQVFLDVKTDSEYAKDIQYAYERGIVKGDDYGLLRPDSALSSKDAAVISVRAAGYTFEPDIEITTSHTVLKGVKCADSSSITVGEAMDILWNALELNVVNTSNGRYWIDNEVTLLNEIFKVYYIDDVVQADYKVSLIGDVSMNDDCIVLGDKTYSIDEDYSSGYVGYRVKAFVKRDSDDDRIIFMMPLNNEVKSYDVSEIEKYANGKISFVDSKKTLTVSSTAKTVCNFDRIYVLSSGVTLPKSGKIVCIDNNSDGKEDCIFIYDRQYGVVKSVDVDEKQIYIDGSQYKIYNFDDYDFVDIYNYDNEKITIKDIQTSSVAEIYESSDKRGLVMYFGNKQASGQIKSLFRNGDERRIDFSDNKEYKVSPYFDDLSSNTELKIGVECVLLLDSDDNIITIDYSTIKNINYAYLYAYGRYDSFDDEVQVALYDVNKGDIRFDIGRKIKLKYEDGSSESLTTERFANYLDNSFEPGLVLYKTNKDNQIIEIEYPSNDIFSNGFRCVGVTGSATTGTAAGDSRMRLGKANMLGGKILLDLTKTKVLVVPTDFRAKENWCVATVADVFVNSLYYPNVKGYSVDPNSMVAEVVAISEETILATNSTDRPEYSVTIISGFKKMYDEASDEVYDVIEGFVEGEETDFIIDKTVPLSYTTSAGDVIPLEVGDVVRVKDNYRGRIGNIKLLYDCSGEQVYGINDTDDDDYGYGNVERASFGTPYKIIDNAMYIIKNGESVPSKDIYRLDIGYIYEFDKNNRNHVRAINKYEIECTGDNKAFIETYYSESAITVIYK